MTIQTTPQVELPGKAELVAAVRESCRRQRAAEIEQLALIAAMCEVWSVTDASCWDSQDELPAPVIFGEQLITPGAEGTPQVAEFLALELGCALEVSPDAARCLLADVLNLRHRLPIVWENTLTGLVRLWLARKVAQNTTQLAFEAVRRLDAMLGPRLDGMGPTTALREVDRLALVCDPEESARRDEEMAHRQVRFTPVPERGVSLLDATLDPVAAKHLDAAVTRGAQVLAAGGQEGSRDELRAVALGVLAHPAQAYRLLDEGLPLDEVGGGGVRPALAAGAGASAAVGSSKPTTSPSLRCRTEAQAGAGLVGDACAHCVELIVRVGRDEVTAGTGGILAGFGPITQNYLRQVLEGCAKVVVRPVIDLADPVTVNTYRPSSRQRWIVAERDRREMFPYSNRTAGGRGIDVDHTHNWDGSNTSTANLGSLSRRVHRAKTHGGYRVEQSKPGVFHWRTPVGQELWTTRHGTWHTPPPVVWDNDPNLTTRVMQDVLRKVRERPTESAGPPNSDSATRASNGPGPERPAGKASAAEPPDDEPPPF